MFKKMVSQHFPQQLSPAVHGYFTPGHFSTATSLPQFHPEHIYPGQLHARQIHPLSHRDEIVMGVKLWGVKFLQVKLSGGKVVMGMMFWFSSISSLVIYPQQNHPRPTHPRTNSSPAKSSPAKISHWQFHPRPFHPRPNHHQPKYTHDNFIPDHFIPWSLQLTLLS